MNALNSVEHWTIESCLLDHIAFKECLGRLPNHSLEVTRCSQQPSAEGE